MGPSSPLVHAICPTEFQSLPMHAFAVNKLGFHSVHNAQQPILTAGSPFQATLQAFPYHPLSFPYLTPLQLQQAATAVFQSLDGPHPLVSRPLQAPPHLPFTPSLVPYYPIQTSSPQASLTLQPPPTACVNSTMNLPLVNTSTLSPKYGDMAASPYPPTHPPSEFFTNPLTITPSRIHQSTIPSAQQISPLRKALSNPNFLKPSEPFSHSIHPPTPSKPPSILSIPGPNSTPPGLTPLDERPPLNPAAGSAIQASADPSTTPLPMARLNCHPPRPLPNVTTPHTPPSSSSQSIEYSQQALLSA